MTTDRHGHACANKNMFDMDKLIMQHHQFGIYTEYHHGHYSIL